MKTEKLVKEILNEVTKNWYVVAKEGDEKIYTDMSDSIGNDIVKAINLAILKTKEQFVRIITEKDNHIKVLKHDLQNALDTIDSLMKK